MSSGGPGEQGCAAIKMCPLVDQVSKVVLPSKCVLWWTRLARLCYHQNVSFGGPGEQGGDCQQNVSFGGSGEQGGDCHQNMSFGGPGEQGCAAIKICPPVDQVSKVVLPSKYVLRWTRCGRLRCHQHVPCGGRVEQGCAASMGLFGTTL